MNNPRVALIIPVWYKDEKGFKMTVDCLLSMEKTVYSNYQMIIVDDCSPYDKYKELYSLFQDRHIVVQTPANGGSTVAVNYGIALTDAPFIQYQNNDTLFPHINWLEEQMRLFDNPEVGVVGCQMRYETGLIQHAGAAWRAMDNHCIDHIGQYQQEIPYFEDVPFVTGCGMTVRREILEQNGGGFTVFEGYGWDDIDIQIKAKAMGYTVKVAPNAQFIHLGSVSYKERPDLASKENYIKNLKLFDDIEIKENEIIQYFIDKYYKVPYTSK